MVAEIVGPLAERIGLPAPLPGAIEVLDEYVGVGYGIPTASSEEATELFARLEGIPLDPSYGAKAGAGLIDLVRRRVFGPRDTVCFWHTGGATWHRPPGPDRRVRLPSTAGWRRWTVSESDSAGTAAGRGA